jgi:hypothetical protein
MARITSQIKLANSGGTTSPSSFTVGSYASIQTQDGPNTVTIDLVGTWSQTGGLSVLFVPLQSPSFTTEPVQTIPGTALTARNPANTNGLASGVQDTFTLGVNGAGTLYVIAGSATFTGPVTVTLGQAQGNPSTQTGQGDAVNVDGPALTLLGSVVGAVSGSAVSGAHKIYWMEGRNASATTLYLMAFDASSLPGNGSAPIAQVCVPFGVTTSPTIGSVQFMPNFIGPTATGIYLAWSTTDGTLTVASSGTGLSGVVYGV